MEQKEVRAAMRWREGGCVRDRTCGEKKKKKKKSEVGTTGKETV